MNALPLNLPNKKDQFESVPFVHNMTEHRKNVLIKRMWNSIQMLSNQMENRHPDVAKVLDMILDGHKWTKKDLEDRYVYHAYGEYVLKYDTKEKRIHILDQNHDEIEESIKGITVSDLKKEKVQA